MMEGVAAVVEKAEVGVAVGKAGARAAGVREVPTAAVAMVALMGTESLVAPMAAEVQEAELVAGKAVWVAAAVAAVMVAAAMAVATEVEQRAGEREEVVMAAVLKVVGASKAAVTTAGQVVMAAK